MSEAASITSDGSDSEFPNRRYARSYNPESNRGRRKVTVPPQSIRAGQNRDAQRAFRARKQAYVDGLKDKVQELTALLADNALYLECERLKQRVASLEAEKASLPSQSQSPDIHVINCSTCIAEQFKSSVLHSQLNQMESRLSSLSNENQSLKQQLAVSTSVSPNFGLSSYPGTAYSVNEWLAVLQGGEESGLKSANDLYGPVELDSARIALQSVKSLQGNGVADQFLDVIDAQSKTTSPQTIRMLQVKLSICAQTALSLCTIVDRQKCIEIYANLFIRNRLQLVSTIFYQLFLNFEFGRIISSRYPS
ncbi:hypothetical protein BCR33DRAFT_564071 [Rhizoclosmatium globosum]|uniref:BZIP domain-containing protein n=1 Tax=Rhizoclosmatium globosum TaxID=329046 RepID=A0A1Y2B750_9FUNG|nr:hypothetical protein BCR33DRAFT_564071 [Rhizoclosmatium globosum]|eukprot:ORY30671.1 hypothetical protein BCR33DRAFT_564071 [Rhizoclosmatium globosum]